jgi:hypothetical protein
MEVFMLAYESGYGDQAAMAGRIHGAEAEDDIVF